VSLKGGVQLLSLLLEVVDLKVFLGLGRQGNELMTLVLLISKPRVTRLQRSNPLCIARTLIPQGLN
jgi:hypothetical protein